MSPYTHSHTGRQVQFKCSIKLHYWLSSTKEDLNYIWKLLKRRQVCWIHEWKLFYLEGSNKEILCIKYFITLRNFSISFKSTAKTLFYCESNEIMYFLDRHLALDSIHEKQTNVPSKKVLRSYFPPLLRIYRKLTTNLDKQMVRRQ